MEAWRIPDSFQATPGDVPSIIQPIQHHVAQPKPDVVVPRVWIKPDGFCEVLCGFFKIAQQATREGESIVGSGFANICLLVNFRILNGLLPLASTEIIRALDEEFFF